MRHIDIPPDVCLILTQQYGGWAAYGALAFSFSGRGFVILKNDEMYTIGQMSELCHISAQLLRYYDQNGIIVPAYRDEDTNYRFYTRDQIPSILLLQELRSLSIPVKTIRKLFLNRDLGAFETELEAHRRDLQSQIAALQTKHDQTLDMLLRVMRGRILLEKQQGQNLFQVVHFHRRPVVYTRYSSCVNVKNLFLSRRAELLKLAADQQYTTIGSHMAIFHCGGLQQFSQRPEEEWGDLEVLMEIKHDGHGNHSRILDGFDAVSGVFVGPYAEMEPVYHAMLQYAQSQGLTLTGTALEEYLVGVTMTEDPHQYVTRIYLPICP